MRLRRCQERKFVGTAWFDAVVIGVVAALVGFRGVGFLASSANRDRAQHINHDAGLIFAGIERSLRGVESELLALNGLFAAGEETAELISGYLVFASIDGAHRDPSLRSVRTWLMTR